nr:MAG: capsid protein [ssDNA virus sp.]
MPYSKIEQKYKYSVIADQNISLVKQGVDPGIRSATYNVLLFNISYPELGSGHNQRIGNRISNCKLNYNLQFKTPYPGIRYLSESNVDLVANPQYSMYHPDQWMRCRLFIVSFKDEVFEQTILEWFNQTFWKNTREHPTMLQKNMSMTTPFTGDFTILHDQVITLKNKSLEVNGSISLGNFMFDKDSSVTQPLSKYIRVFIICPQLYEYDMDRGTQNFLLRATSAGNLIAYSVQATMKLNYLDM